MRFLVLVIVGYVLLGLEASLLYHLKIPFHAPDLGAIMAVYVGLTQGFVPGIFCVTVIGFLQDGYAMGAPVGLHAACLVMIFLITYPVSSRITFRSGVPVMVVAALSAIFSQFILFALTAIFDQRIDNYGMFVDGWLINALIAGPFGPIVFWILEWSIAAVNRSHRNRVFFR
jgi:rod shape-determining protein MreD